MARHARTPLTASQSLIWQGERLYPDSALYNMPFVFHIEGNVDPDRFEAAFRALIQRHDALRTVFSRESGTPEGILKDAPAGVFTHQDFRSEPAPDDAFQRWLSSQATAPFLLDRELWRSTLATLSADRSAWVLNAHHLVVDAVSYAILFRDLCDLYSGKNASELSPCASFSAAVEREQKDAGTPRGHQAIDFWRNKPPINSAKQLYGQTDDSRRIEAVRKEIFLDAQTTQELNRIATQGVNALTLQIGQFCVYASLLAAFIHRISGDETIRIGILGQTRNTRELRSSVGLYLETWPLDVRVEGTDTFYSLLERMAGDFQQSLRHVRPGVSVESARNSPQFILNYLPIEDFSNFAGFPVRTEWVHTKAIDPSHKMRLHVHDFSVTGRSTLQFDLKESAFGPREQSFVPHHFLNLLQHWVGSPDLPLHSVALESSSISAQRTAFNATSAPPSQLRALVSPDSKPADKLSVAIATSSDSGPRKLTYGELTRCASALATLLRTRGIGRGSIVPLYMAPSMESVVSVLAILQTGAAFLPLDPTHPSKRLDGIVTEAGSVFELQALLDRAAEPCPIEAVERIAVDVNQLLRSPSTPAPFADRNPDDLAYVLYTSGTTGTPKGTLITDKGLSNYLTWAAGYYLPSQAVNMPLFTSIAFDLTLTSVLLPVVTGGSVHVFEDTTGNVAKLVSNVLSSPHINLVKLTPSHLKLTAQGMRYSDQLAGMIFGGEALPTETALRALEAGPHGFRVFNEYGPTETVIGCMIHTFDPTRERSTFVPIGRPIRNTQIHVLDEHLDPVPKGIVGELCIGGDGVGIGYLDRPKLTQERFVEDPFIPNARMYRSGDLARWVSEDELEFLGRADRQVKLHGVRIELDEIGETLSTHPSVSAAAVTLSAAPAATDPEVFCTRCGLSSRYPDTTFDEQGVCNMCVEFATYRFKLDDYFRDDSELQQKLDRIRTRRRDRDGQYDCLMLLSGGKDSTYVLYQLVAHGMKVLTYTLDNGFIPESTKQNILRVTQHLDVDHVFGSTPHMNEIFADSLTRHSNVCNGCFKTLYTLSMNLAKERGIPCIVTGLARGQLFETRLVDMCFTGEFDPDRIDATVLSARKAYHKIQDATTRLLPVANFEDDAIFDEIEFLDYFRYTDVTLDQMYSFLKQHAPWIRPEDTGRSTNCSINDTGIYVHTFERGFHNYSLPYSWDVRLGHKTRDAAMAELRDDIDVADVARILSEIGYQPQEPRHGSTLVAYYCSSADSIDATEPEVHELRAYLSERLPPSMVPAQYVRLDSMPMSANGKIDFSGLPDLIPDAPVDTTPPSNDNERLLLDVWCRAFGATRIGIHTDFFEIGGDSVLAIQIIDQLEDAGWWLEPKDLFENPTVSQAAALIQRKTSLRNAGRDEPGAFELVNLNDDDKAKLGDLLADLDRKGRTRGER